MRILHITVTYYPATFWCGSIFSVYHLNNALAHIPGVELKVLTTDSAGRHMSDRLNVPLFDKAPYFSQEVILRGRVASTCTFVGQLIWTLFIIFHLLSFQRIRVFS